MLSVSLQQFTLFSIWHISSEVKTPENLAYVKKNGDIPFSTAHYSDGPLFRRPIIPTIHCSDSPLFQPIIIKYITCLHQFIKLYTGNSRTTETTVWQPILFSQYSIIFIVLDNNNNRYYFVTTVFGIRF